MSAPKEERTVEIIVNGTKANASLKEMSAAAAVLSNQVAKIAADDPKRAELITQLQQMRQRIADARAEIGGLLTAEQQLAAQQQQLTEAAAATVAEQQRAIAAGQASTASMAEMKTAAGLLERQLHELASDDPNRAALLADFQTLKGRLEEARASMAGVIKTEAQLRAEEDALRASTEALRQQEVQRLAAQQEAIALGKQASASYTEIKMAAGLLEQQLHALNTDDEGRAELIADYQELRARLEALQQQMTRTARSSVEIVVNGQRVSASMREMREAAGELERQLDELAQDDPARGPLIGALQQLRERIHLVQDEVNGVAQATTGMHRVMEYALGSLIGGGIEGLIDKVLETGRAVFDTTAKFEKYGVILENALGSKSLAQKALADIKQLAVETPFSVDELTDSYIKLVNRGITPSMAEMKNLADVAASQGKDFDQLAEAVLDAGTGEFERLKELGIGASKAGDQVTLSFKNQQVVVANTPAAIQRAIVGFGDLKGVMGSTDVIAQSLEGQLSNLGDTADQTAIEWGTMLRPAFVAVLSTLGFVLGMLKALPSFIKENKGVLLALAGAVVVLNAEMVTFNLQLLAESVRLKAGLVWKAASAAATDVMAFSWRGLNAAMMANPIGFVIGLVMLLAGAIVAAYEKSETFRNVINGLGQALYAFGKTYIQGLINYFVGLYEVMASLLTLDGDRLKRGIKQTFDGVKGTFWDAGVNAAKAFGEGYNEEQAKQASEANKRYQEQRAAFLQKIKDFEAKHLKDLADAKKKSQLEALKNEEADLKERLAKAAKDSEAEMRLQQQLVTNDAKQKLLAEKLTAADRRIILADALDKRTKLEQDYIDKRDKAAEAARKKAAAEALKQRVAEIEAEQHQLEAKAKLRHAAIIARGDEHVSELSAIYTEGELKIAALQATAKKEIAHLEGTAAQKKARARVLEQELATDIAVVREKVRLDQVAKLEQQAKEDYDLQKKFIDGQVEAIEDQATRQQAAFDVMVAAGLQSQQDADRAKYEARQAAFAKELALVEASLGKESETYKKLFASMVKDQADFSKKEVAEREKAAKAKERLQKLEMRTAGQVLDFGLELLDQDADARKKHHSLYTALAAAKILIDGTKEVQQIWEYSAENPANGPTAGAAGIAMGAIQTAVAIARTAVALGKLRGGGGDSGDNASYAQGGATGDGAQLAVSPMGQLLAMSGMRVGSNGRLLDGTGFAVAGVVHEDEYVIPKWQLQDPQVAAVAQWLEARRLRGFADGGATGSGSSGAALPVAAASPSTDGEKTYAVQTQMLAALLSMGEQLADVKQWQRELQVRLDLRATQSGMDELKQVQQASAIRRK